MSNTKGGNVESCSRIKDGNWRLAQGKDELRRILKICIIYKLKNKFQSTCVALVEFGEVTTSEESQLEEQRLR